MHPDAISREQRAALSALSAVAGEGFYLAGGSPYPSVHPPEPSLGVPVASLADIAAMKIEAIASRGAKKDFVDLYFICQDELPLRGAISAFKTRFAAARPDVAHRVMALAYFEDAEREPEPMLLRPVAWNTVKAFFEREVRALWNEGL